MTGTEDTDEIQVPLHPVKIVRAASLGHGNWVTYDCLKDLLHKMAPAQFAKHLQ